MSDHDCQCWVGHGGCGGCSGYPGILHEPACGFEWNPDCPQHGGDHIKATSDEQHQHEIGAINCGCGWHPSCVAMGNQQRIVAAGEAVLERYMSDECPHCHQSLKWSREGFWYHTDTGLADCEIQEIP